MSTSDPKLPEFLGENGGFSRDLKLYDVSKGKWSWYVNIQTTLSLTVGRVSLCRSVVSGFKRRGIETALKLPAPAHMSTTDPIFWGLHSLTQLSCSSSKEDLRPLCPKGEPRTTASRSWNIYFKVCFKHQRFYLITIMANVCWLWVLTLCSSMTYIYNTSNIRK